MANRPGPPALRLSSIIAMSVPATLSPVGGAAGGQESAIVAPEGGHRGIFLPLLEFRGLRILPLKGTTYG